MPRLTKTLIEELEPHPKQYIVHDDDVSGFGVRVLPSGCKTFIVRYRTEAGAARWMSLGRWPNVVPEEARKHARRITGAVAGGEDPQADRQSDRAQSTVNELCDAYMERHAKPRKRTWKKDESYLARHVRPVWGSRPAASIRRADVAALHHAIGTRRGKRGSQGADRGGGPYEANRTMEVVRKMFNLAATWGFVPEESANPTKGVELYTEKSRERWVMPAELPRLAQSVDLEADPAVRCAVWLYVLLGLRRAELLGLRWDQVDLEAEQPFLRLPTSKSGRAHLLPISSQAVELFKALPRAPESPWCFPSTKDPAQARYDIQGAWRRIAARAGLPDVRLHDLRRTCGSWLANAGTSLLMIGRVLNQTQQQTTAVYARLAIDPIAEAMQQNADRIFAAREPKAPTPEPDPDPVPSNVIQFVRRT